MIVLLIAIALTFWIGVIFWFVTLWFDSEKGYFGMLALFIFLLPVTYLASYY